MKFLKFILAVMFSLFALIVVIYWYNLDTKLVKVLQGPMMRHYDNLPRDSHL